jgi:hypothetical protein
MSANDSWDEIAYRRRLETFDEKDDNPVLSRGPGRETDGIWYIQLHRTAEASLMTVQPARRID